MEICAFLSNENTQAWLVQTYFVLFLRAFACKSAACCVFSKRKHAQAVSMINGASFFEELSPYDFSRWFDCVFLVVAKDNGLAASFLCAERRCCFQIFCECISKEIVRRRLCKARSADPSETLQLFGAGGRRGHCRSCGVKLIFVFAALVAWAAALENVQRALKQREKNAASLPSFDDLQELRPKTNVCFLPRAWSDFVLVVKSRVAARLLRRWLESRVRSWQAVRRQLGTSIGRSLFKTVCGF